MPSYYSSEDLARFGEISRTTPQNFELFLKWYGATTLGMGIEPPELDELFLVLHADVRRTGRVRALVDEPKRRLS